VQALRAEIAPKTISPPRSSAVQQPVAPAPAASSSFPWGMALGFAALAGLVYVVLQRRRPPVAPAAPSPYYGNNAPGMPAQPMGPASGGAPYGTPYGPAAAPAPGMGSHLMGGLATGLAAGAGMVAAQEIGRRMMGDHHAAAPAAAQDGFLPIEQNADMGGNDFGINDPGSWDDAGAGGGVSGDDNWDT
jgi:hypothetical protein